MNNIKMKNKENKKCELRICINKIWWDCINNSTKTIKYKNWSIPYLIIIVQVESATHADSDWKTGDKLTISCKTNDIDFSTTAVKKEFNL